MANIAQTGMVSLPIHVQRTRWGWQSTCSWGVAAPISLLSSGMKSLQESSFCCYSASSALVSECDKNLPFIRFKEKLIKIFTQSSGSCARQGSVVSSLQQGPCEHHPSSEEEILGWPLQPCCPRASPIAPMAIPLGALSPSHPVALAARCCLSSSRKPFTPAGAGLGSAHLLIWLGCSNEKHSTLKPAVLHSTRQGQRLG